MEIIKYLILICNYKTNIFFGHILGDNEWYGNNFIFLIFTPKDAAFINIEKFPNNRKLFFRSKPQSGIDSEIFTFSSNKTF